MTTTQYESANLSRSCIPGREESRPRRALERVRRRESLLETPLRFQRIARTELVSSSYAQFAHADEASFEGFTARWWCGSDEKGSADCRREMEAGRF